MVFNFSHFQSAMSLPRSKFTSWQLLPCSLLILNMKWFSKISRILFHSMSARFTSLQKAWEQNGESLLRSSDELLKSYFALTNLCLQWRLSNLEDSVNGCSRSSVTGFSKLEENFSRPCHRFQFESAYI